MTGISVAVGILSLLLIFISILGKKKYGCAYEGLNKKDFPLPQVGYLGRYILDKMKYSYKHSYDYKMQERLKAIFIEKHEDIYPLYLGYKVGLVLWMALLGGLLGILITFSNKPDILLWDNSLIRQEESSHDISLVMQVNRGLDTLDKRILVTVPPQEETEEEIRLRVEEVEEWLGEQLKGLAQLESSIELPEQVNGVHIEWHTNNDALDHKGQINYDQVPLEGVDLELEAKLDYKGYGPVLSQSVHIKHVERELSLQEATLQLQDNIEAGLYTKDVKIQLPDNIDGVNVKWYQLRGNDLYKILLFSLALGILVFYMKDEEMKKVLKKKERAIHLSFPDMITKYTLLINAGLTSFHAWDKLCMDYKKSKDKTGEVSGLYEEMLLTSQQIKGGVPEYRAYEEMGRRVGGKEVKKFTRILTQSLRKGNEELVVNLQSLGEEAWEERVATAKRLGEEASSKLLFPMMILLIIVIMLVMAPAFMSLKR